MRRWPFNSQGFGGGRMLRHAIAGCVFESGDSTLIAKKDCPVFVDSVPRYHAQKPMRFTRALR
jgi:hypothetical protein